MMIAGRCPAVSIASYPTNPAHVCKITMSVHARITCVKFVRSSITWQQSCFLGLYANLVKLYLKLEAQFLRSEDKKGLH